MTRRYLSGIENPLSFKQKIDNRRMGSYSKGLGARD